MSLLEILNMDAILEVLTAGLIETAKHPDYLKKIGAITEFSEYRPNEKLRILLVGYNGARNTGADVRVETMVNQLYHVLGKENIQLGIMTLDVEHSKNYYRDPTELIPLGSVFFKDILRAASRYHMAVLSEGSCFKSKFANALTTFFLAGAGIMASQGKPCIAYGSEAGKMDWLLKAMVKRYGKHVYVISRTEPSMKVVERLGIRGDLGTDTAWTFMPSPPSKAEEILKKHGWDGKKPVLGLAVINPFWWPVRPNLFRFLAMKLGGKGKENHYDKWYFFSTSPERDRLFRYYIDAVARSSDEFVDKHNVFPVIIGMERLDFTACKRLQERMRRKAPIVCSLDYNGYDMTAILHKLTLLITSRYHARVLSMTGGVASAAISMDERLENLLGETGHVHDYYLKTDDPILDVKLPAVMEKLWTNREKVKGEILQSIPGYLQKMASMAELFKDFLWRTYPGFPIKGKARNWRENIPPLTDHLEEIMNKYG